MLKKYQIPPDIWQKMTKKQRRLAIKKKKVKNPQVLTKVRKVQLNPLKKTLGDKMGTDVRVLNSAAQDLGLKNQTKAVTVVVNLEAANIVYLAMGYVSKAFERGYSGGAAIPQSPFYALTYMCEIVLAFAAATPIPVTQLPFWLLCLVRAVSPKLVEQKQGSVSYKFNYTGASPIRPTVNQIMGFFSYGNTWSAGWENSSVLVDGFPTVSVTPIAYTDPLGQSAFQDLCQFMADNTTDPGFKKSAALVPVSSTTPFDSDVSVYAIVQQWQGVGCASIGGGFFGLAQHEVPIQRPLLTLFLSSLDPGGSDVPNRFFAKSWPVAGDNTFLGASLCDMFTLPETHSRERTKFHAVDFLEFGDVVAIWMQTIAQSLLNADPTLLAAAVVCPLTLQEVLLLLRNTIMGGFRETQGAVQGLLPWMPSGSTDNQFNPFTSSVGSCPLQTLDMQLPIPLIENIRALAGKKVPTGSTGVCWYAPVLGQYETDSLSSGDYLITPQGGEPVSVFTTGAIFRKKVKDVKGNIVVMNLLETPISLIDGDAAGTLVMINSPARLKILVDMWNDWLKSTGVGSYSVQMGTFGTEKGITALSSVTMTRHWVPVAPEIAQESFNSDSRLQKNSFKYLTSTIYANRQAYADSSQGRIIATCYEQVLQTWILPVIETEDSAETNSTLLQRWQLAMEENFLASYTTGESGITLSSLHAAYAKKMCKTVLQEPDDWTKFFEAMSATGRGGILSAVVANLVSSFVPSAKGLLTSISDMLPI